MSVGFDGRPTTDDGRTWGVLVLAHGGSDEWNQLVEDAVEEAGLTSPTAVAFGMGMHHEAVKGMQAAVDALGRQGVQHLIAVPLLVSSRSQIMRQYAFLLGLRDVGPWDTHVQPLTVPMSVELTAALDDDPVVSEILLERVAALSRAPAEEAVVIVAHGPTTEADNTAWLLMMQRLAGRLEKTGGFDDVVPVTMRDDAEPLVLDAAIAQMRSMVEHLSRERRVLVVPLLIASGGIEHKIPERLDGLEFVFGPAALLPHPKMSEWIRRRVNGAAAREGAVAHLQSL